MLPTAMANPAVHYGKNNMNAMRMRRYLADAASPATPPSGVSLLPFDPNLHIAAVHALLDAAYANGFGSVPPLDEWWESISDDAEYDQDLIILAVDSDQLPIAVMHCWTSAYIKDLVVSTNARRRGVGSFLLRHAFWTFYIRGAEYVDLKVGDKNLPALALYSSEGMTVVGGET